jgi:hypothetical protein
VALIVSAFDLVAKVDAVRGGAQAFARVAQNRTFCTDTLLVRVSFMNASDREHFAAKVHALCEGPLARVDKHSKSSDVEWLGVGRYAGVEAVWLRDEPRGPLVVPVAWTPGALTFTRREEAEEHLEYLGAEGNVEVYRDRRTGEKLYTGRTRPPLPPAEVGRLDALQKEATGLVSPLVLGGPRSLGFFESAGSRRPSGCSRTWSGSSQTIGLRGGSSA